MKRYIWLCLLLMMLVGCTAPAQQPTPIEEKDEEITVTIMVEGMEETVSAIRHTSALGYSVIYDPASVTLQKQEGADLYIDPYEGDIPDCYFRISLWEGDAMDLADEVGTVGGYPAVFTRSAEGMAWDSVIREFVFITVGERVYHVEIGYFSEAAEGYGTRLQAMLQTLEFIE